MDRSQLIQGLRELDPANPYGTELFDALARLTVSVAVEAVCLRLQRRLVDGDAIGTPSGRIITPDASYDELQVYMVRRSPDDTAYPGEWHCPGSVIRRGEDVADVFSRLSMREFDGAKLQWRFIANVNYPTEARGHFLSLVYLCVLEDAEGLKGKWFPVNQLPEKTVENHRYRIIPAAVGAFVAENTKICF